MKLIYILRSFFGTIGLVVLTLYVCLGIIIMSFTPWGKTAANSMLQHWGQVACALFGVRVEVYGLENRPQQGCILLFNHTSFFDIFVMAGALKGIRFGAKIELFNIPILGAAMRMSGTLPIARNRKEEVFRVYKEARSRFSVGDQIALAPEGARQDTETLGHFKSGPFVFAMQAGVPLVPIVIQGALDIMPRGSIFPNTNQWNQKIKLMILPAVDVSKYELENRLNLQNHVHSMMSKYLNE